MISHVPSCEALLALRLVRKARATQDGTDLAGACWQPVDADSTPCHMSGERCPRHGEDVHPRAIAALQAQTQVPRTERQRLLDAGYAVHELVEIKGVWTVKVMGLLRMVHSRYGIQSLDVTMTTLTADYALAHATLVLKDGRTFGEDGISTPKNVGTGVQTHWQTMALTRAKGRVCRNVLCEQAPSTEEMGE